MRRQKHALRRSSASVATSEATVEPPKISENFVAISEAITEPPTAQPPKVMQAKENVTSKEKNIERVTTHPIIVHTATTTTTFGEPHHSEDNPSHWMREIVKNAKHKPPPVRRGSTPTIDPNNLFGRGDLSDAEPSSIESGSENDDESVD